MPVEPFGTHRLMRAFVPIALNQLTTLLLGLAYVKLVNKFIPPAVIGPFGSFFVTLSQVAALVTHSGLVNHTTRYWRRENEQLGSYAWFLFRASYAQLKYLAPLLFGICLALSLSRGELVWMALFPLLVLSNFALALNAIAAGALNAHQSGWRFFLLNFAGTAARTFVPVGLALLAGVTLWILSIGYSLHALIVLLFVIGLFRWASGAAKAEDEKWRQWTRELKEYGRPFVLLGAGAWLLQSADRWVVAGFFSEEQAGVFVVAFGLAAIVPTMIVAVLMQLSFPRIFHRADHARTLDDWRGIARICDQLTIVFLALSLSGLVAMRVIAPLLVGPLISESYVPALGMLIPAGLAVVASQINQFHYLLLQGQHNSAAMVKVMMVVASVKTFGSIAAAAVSWSAFMWWLAASALLAGLIGRFMIRKIALSSEAIQTASRKDNG